jgi:hypothetical protein
VARARPEGGAREELRHGYVRVRRYPRRRALHLSLWHALPCLCSTTSHADSRSVDPLPTDATAPTDPNGRVPDPFSYALSQQAPTRTSNAGSIKIVDSAVFKASKEIAMAEVSIEPGHMRELHWHPTEDGTL